MSEGNELKAYYVDIWREMLTTILGWKDPQITRWIEEHIDLARMDSPDDWYYHETPQYWILSAIIPESYKQHLSPKEVAELRLRLLSSFKDEHFYHFPVGTDWRPFKEKIDVILSEYSGSRPGTGPGSEGVQ